MTLPESSGSLSSPVRRTTARRISPVRRLGQGLLVVYRTLRTNPLSFAGFVMVVLLGVAALIIQIDPAVLPHPALSYVVAQSYQSPSWAHPFGTDELGRDIFSNVLAALPIDLAVAALIAGGSLLFGSSLGIVAGYYDRPRSVGAVTSVVILRATDLFLAFPSLILALAFVVALGRGFFQVVLAVFLTWWPYYVRLARGEVLAVKNQPYIAAARAAGVRERRIVLRHVLRNILEPLLVYFTLDLGTAIVVFSTVVYVTGALPYPTAPPVEWGAMIAFYYNYVNTIPWAVLFPGLAILVTVLAFSLLGDGLRDVLDPRSRRVLVRAEEASLAMAHGGGGLPVLLQPNEVTEPEAPP